MICAIGALAIAATQSAWAADSVPALPEPAVLVVLNRPVMTFRAPSLGYTPAERAAQSRERLGMLLRRGGAGSVTLETVPQGVAINVDGALAFLVAPGDISASKGESLEAAARSAADRLRQAIADTRELRDFEAMGKAAALAVAATLVFAALAWILHRARRALAARLTVLASRHAERVNLGGVRVFDRSRTIVVLQRLVSGAYWLVLVILAYEWVGWILERFPYTRPWGERLNGFLLGTIADLLDAMVRAVPDLLIAAVIFLIAWVVAGAVQRFFKRIEGGRDEIGWLDADTARPTRRLATIAIWLLALVMAYPYLPGASTDAFKGVSVLVGLMVSLGGASVVGQALSGLILMYTRTFRVGEYVRIGEHEGTVVEVGMYQTRVQTGLGEQLFLPNALVLQSVTRNYSRDASLPGYTLITAYTIGYDAPWRQVNALLEEAASRTPGVLAQPQPRIVQVALSDFYVEYRLVVQVDASEPRLRVETRSRLYQNVLDTFNEHGVQVMSPHYLGDPADAKIVPKARWYAAPAVPPREA